MTRSCTAGTGLGWGALLLMLSACGGAGTRPVLDSETPGGAVSCGIDVLRDSDFAALAGRRIGLITNHTGRCNAGRRTADLLWDAPTVELIALFGPEHGLEGVFDTSVIAHGTDGATGLRIHSLYGETRKPTQEMLAGLDTLVFDIQDIGTRFYTFVSTMGLALEAAAEHGLRFVVLDRPNPLGGVIMEGPVQDAGLRSFTGFHELPVRHGMTVGELARMFVEERGLEVDLQVVELLGWRRRAGFERTGLVWVAPSPNMRRLSQALLYPGIGLLEFTNVSVGRGTDTPFERLGAPWIDGARLARHMNAASLPGFACTPVSFTPDASRFMGERCGGIDLFITDWEAFESVATGYTLACALRDLFAEDWEPERYERLLGDAATLTALAEKTPIAVVGAAWEAELEAFRVRRAPFLLYD